MVKQSPSRNHRSKGVKAKQVLQICVLLAVCFWLIYQVKHSHDKKKAFDESDAKISLKMNDHDEILKFGRKDLLPRLEETTMKNEKHGEVEAEEEETGGGEEEEDKQHEEEEVEDDKQEEEEVEEDDKHEEEEHEDNNIEEKEDEGRGGGDDEIDERDQEKSEVEVEREEDLIDEEKEREEGDEKEAEDKEGQSENESSLEDRDHDGGSRNAHEAREENYRADDASSAVTHETEAISTENEEEDKVNSTEEITVDQNTRSLETEEGEMAENGIRPNVTGKEEKGYDIVSSKSEDNYVLNSTTTTESRNQPDLGNDSTKGNLETNNLSAQDGTETKPDSTEARNATVGNIALGQENNSYAASNNNQSVSNLMISSNAKNAEADLLSEKVMTSNASVEAFGEVEGHSGSLTTEKNSDATQNEKSETDNGTDESSEGSSKTENADEVHHDPIDSSDSSIPLEEKDARMDLDTLPEIRTEGTNNEDAVAE